jgi:hypothetical protein
MKNIKSFKIFESKSITIIEVENIINDILLDLKDINDRFSWKISMIGNPPKSKEFRSLFLNIICKDDASELTFALGEDWNKKRDGFQTRIFNGIKKDFKDILDRLFEVLISEDLKVQQVREFGYDRDEFKPGKINNEWILDPTSQEWRKEFYIFNPLK